MAALATAPEMEVAEPVEVSTEVSEVETPSGETQEGEQQEQTQQTEEESKLPLVKQAQPQLDKIKAENPGLAAKIKDALYRDQQIAKELPEGIKGAVALRNEVASLATALNDPQYVGAAPAQVIADVKSQLGYFHGLDSKFTSGSPEFVDALETASPEAFQTLMINGLGKFAQTNPEGYSAYASQAVDSFFESKGMTVEWEVLREFLPNLPEFAGKARVVAALEKIYGLTQQVKDYAKKPIAAVKKKDDPAANLDQRQQVLDAKELDITRQNWNSSSVSFGTTLRDKEITRLAGKTVLTDAQKTKIKNLVTEEVDARCEADRKYGDDMRNFLKSGDMEGYKRRLHSQYQKLIPGATGRAYSDVVTTKPAVKVAPKPPATAPVTSISEDRGYHPVSKYPVGQVDLNRTRQKDLDAGRLTLKNGSKVLYKRAS